MSKCSHSIEQGLSNFDMYWVILEGFLLKVICLFYFWISILACEYHICIISMSCTPASSSHSCPLHFLSSLWPLLYLLLLYMQYMDLCVYLYIQITESIKYCCNVCMLRDDHLGLDNLSVSSFLEKIDSVPLSNHELPVAIHLGMGHFEIAHIRVGV